MWISGSGSTLMAATDDTIVSSQVRLPNFPASAILTCDTEGAQIGICNAGLQTSSAPRVPRAIRG